MTSLSMYFARLNGCKVAGLVAATATGVILAVLDARDFSRTPATDTADVVATLVVVIGGATWFGLRRFHRCPPAMRLVGAVVGGAALGALLVGLASVVYDPFAK